MPAEPKPASSLRWRIAILVSVAIAISYLDRQTLPVAIDSIRRQIPVTDGQFANLNVAFLLTYALMYAAGGRLMDKLGTRLGFTLIMVFWSLACASHGFATTLVMLVGSRLLLGIGEGGGFPAATRAMAEWFPAGERSVAMGIMNGGTAIGGILAPPFIALILVHWQLNWRWVFFLTGAMGLLWTLWWRWEYYPPEQHPRLKAAQASSLSHSEIADEHESSPSHPSATSNKTSIRWFDLLKHRQTWGLVIAKYFSDAAWYFYLFWLPKYLYDARQMDIKHVGYYAWIPHASAGIGCMLGGILSAVLIQRACSVDAARKIALGLSACLMPLVFFIPSAPVGWVIFFFSVAYFGQQSWSTLVMTLPADIFPNQAVGAVAGLVGFGGAMGGVSFLEGVGYMLDHHTGYGPVFAMAGSFHVLAFIILCVFIPKIKPLTLSQTITE